MGRKVIVRLAKNIEVRRFSVQQIHSSIVRVKSESDLAAPFLL